MTNIPRDPREWVILEEDEKYVVFSTGKAKIRTSKRGTIYREWVKEMKRIAAGGPVVEMTEGELIEPVWMDRALQFEPIEIGRIEPEEPTIEDKKKALLAREDRKELAGLQWRLEGLRAQLRALPYCRHEDGYCSTECKVREEIRELERQCFGGQW